MSKILTPQKQFEDALNKKQAELAKTIKDLLDKEGFELKVAQNIIIVPKKDYVKK